MKKEKKILTLILALLLLTLVGMPVFASEEHGRDIDTVVEEILQSTNSQALSEVSPQSVAPELLEELGDAVMGLLLNSDWQHERMDAMLGGEGSYQLASYHRNLGEEYIASGGSLSEFGAYGGGWMMPGGMMGVSRFSRFSPYESRWGRWDSRESRDLWTAPWNRRSLAGNRWLWGLPILLAAAAAVLAAVILLGIRRRHKSEDQAGMILKNRFAKGEISKQEFDRMKKILR